MNVLQSHVYVLKVIAGFGVIEYYPRDFFKGLLGGGGVANHIRALYSTYSKIKGT